MTKRYRVKFNFNNYVSYMFVGYDESKMPIFYDNAEIDTATSFDGESIALKAVCQYVEQNYNYIFHISAGYKHFSYTIETEE